MTSQRFEYPRRLCLALASLILVVGAAPAARAQVPAGSALVEALRGGGYSICFRHTAPFIAPRRAASGDSNW